MRSSLRARSGMLRGFGEILNGSSLVLLDVEMRYQRATLSRQDIQLSREARSGLEWIIQR